MRTRVHISVGCARGTKALTYGARTFLLGAAKQVEVAPLAQGVPAGAVHDRGLRMHAKNKLNKKMNPDGTINQQLQMGYTGGLTS